MNLGREVRELTVEPVEWPQAKPAERPPERAPVAEPEKVGAE